MTGESWFSNTPDRQATHPHNKTVPKEILAKRSGELRSRRMKTAMKSPAFAKFRSGIGFFLAEAPPSDAPKHLFRPFSPATAFFPPSGPATAFPTALTPKANS
jgi:hypothetical protein